MPKPYLPTPLPTPPDPLAVAVAAARARLTAYCIGQRPGYRVYRHHALIADTLEAVERGDIKRLMIFAPPRHGKTELVSANFPAWWLGRRPRDQIIATTYAQDYADDLGRRVRDAMATPLHRAAFPASELRRDSRAVSRFGTSVGGSYVAVGMGGPITGRGANLLVIDDPVKNAQDATSDAVQRAHREWYRQVAYTRLMPGGAIVLIITRWTEGDLAGWILQEQAADGWSVLTLPALAESDDALGREPGEALWPEAYDTSRLHAIRDVLGSNAFAAMYQQRPVPESGGLFQRSWWRTYDDVPEHFDEMLGSWDCSFKDRASSDFVVGQVWGRIGTRFYLLDQTRARLNFPATLVAFRALQAKWPRVGRWLVEDKANGTAVLDTLRSEIPGLVAVEPDGGKVARASAVSGLVEAGNVYLPARAPWLADLLTELTSFPLGSHDDQVDALTQALRRLGNRQVPSLDMFRIGMSSAPKTRI